MKPRQSVRVHAFPCYLHVHVQKNAEFNMHTHRADRATVISHRADASQS